MKECLANNYIDGVFQRLVVGNLEDGRKKTRALCIVGASNMAKSSLLYPLAKIYLTYVRPDGGSYHSLFDIEHRVLRREHPQHGAPRSDSEELGGRPVDHHGRFQ